MPKETSDVVFLSQSTAKRKLPVQILETKNLKKPITDLNLTFHF